MGQLIQLTGVANDDPRSRTSREFLFAQGDATGASSNRPIVLYGNKTSAGSEVVETIGPAIQGLSDCWARFGRRSEVTRQYTTAIMVAPGATYYGVAVAENGSGTASAITWTFATTADNISTVRVEWGGRRLEYVVKTGDTVTTTAAGVAAKVNADPDFPFTTSPSVGALAFTAANVGPRGDFIINRLRVYFTTAIATTVTKGSLTPGAGADDVTLALAAVAQRGDLYYHAHACTAAAGVTTTDGGVGQAVTWIRSQSAPSVGFDCQVCFGLDCTQSQATSVATSSSANAVRASFLHVKNSDFSPPMVGAILAAAKWIKEIAYPAASFRGFTTDDTYNFPIPPPYVSSDRLTSTEVVADLNNGVTPVEFSSTGAAVLGRQITSYNLVPGTSNKDYRAREGHIPSVEDAAWEYLEQRWLTVRQEGITDDPPAGQRPEAGFTTPGAMRALVYSAIDVLSHGATSPWGKAILDPGAVDAMKASVYIEQRASGFGVAVNWQPARHDLQDDYQIKQGGPSY